MAKEFTGVLRFLVISVLVWGSTTSLLYATSSAPAIAGWKSYTNARFGFSVQYPPDWQLGKPLADGVGITLYPPAPKTQVTFSGYLNMIEGTSQDGRQTVTEFATAHRRIIQDLYAKKSIALKWEREHTITLGGRPAVQLTFSYRDEHHTDFVEFHIFSVGRNEGRGVRIKMPPSARTTLMPTISQVLQTYTPGRDQDAVSPYVQP
jgi:hypothetical protein